MQPNSSPTTTSSSSSIYINPKFRVHINPNFLSKSNGINQQLGTTAETTFVTAPTQIYVNPRFFGNTNGMTQSSSVVNSTTPSSCINNIRAIENSCNIMAHEYHDMIPLAVEPLADTKIHTRTKICNTRAITTTVPNLSKIAPLVPKIDPTKLLIKIGSKKLLRVPAKTASTSTSPFAKLSKSISKLRRPLQTKYKIVKEQTAFKIDRRSAKAKLAALTLNVLPTVAMNRKLWINESLTPTKTTTSKTLNRSLIITTTLSPLSTRSTKKMPTFLNINGILYKSNRRKLEKTVPNTSSPYALSSVAQSSPSTKTQQPSYRRLIVRGENFLLDASGKHLVRVTTTTTSNKQPSMVGKSNAVAANAGILKRIDIGKVTFVKKSNGTYERTDFHKSRYHLSVAKQRSINTLTNRLVKTNVPCPIFRKLGKCAAYIRGKCTKLHDKKLVDVCPRFLKGACDKMPCLLSHDTTLSKMPTCRFYLQGMCFKTDCPYLHKKVNDKTEICVDFLRGFCEKADQCTKRHEFMCPEQQNKGVCKLTRCPYPHQTRTIKIEQAHIEKPECVRIKRRKHASKCPSKGDIIKTTVKTNAAANEIDEDVKLNVKRYFDDDNDDVVAAAGVDKLKSNSKKTCDQTNSVGSTSENASTITAVQPTNEEDCEKIYVVRKPIVGALPSFIPIG